MFLSAVSGGLVALGPVATATRVGTAFYAFGLALAPTLTFVGLATFERVLQTGIGDHDYTIASACEIASATGAALARSPSRVASSPALPSVFAESTTSSPPSPRCCATADPMFPTPMIAVVILVAPFSPYRSIV
jgi:hypothetical protein